MFGLHLRVNGRGGYREGAKVAYQDRDTIIEQSL